eukprot:4598802-Amphidinium_carterae.1
MAEAKGKRVWGPFSIRSVEFGAAQVDPTPRIDLASPLSCLKTSFSTGDVPPIETNAPKRAPEPVPVGEALAETLVEGEPLKPEAEQVRKNGKKTHCDQAVKTWDLADLQKERFSWTLTRSLQEATLLAPELFADVHVDTPRRWTRKGKAGSSGRRSMPDDVIPKPAPLSQAERLV